MSKRARKVQDKWKIKEWYNIITPPYFGGALIGSSPSSEPAKTIGRILETTLYDITGDFNQQYMKLYFQVTGIKGSDAETIFKGHEYSRDYLRSLVRRGSTRIDSIINITTKDGYKLRVSVVALSVSRIRTSQIIVMRSVIRKIIDEKAKSLNFDQFVQESILGKIASDIYNEAKKFSPLRHVGIRKSKLVLVPASKPLDSTVVEAKV
ncbi:MAG: small subunit ribosomal protein S3Ae [Thermoproteota archaeon]|nr:small subunit ribosomal protein S3Ae [Thermoproteota archaeon]